VDAAIARALDSGWYILGPEVEAFEKEFAAWLGAGHAVGVANGTDAVELALRGLGIGPGDAVYTVSHTAVATVAAIERAGAVPVLLDVDAATYTLDPSEFADAIRADARPGGARPRAVIAVHLYGHPAAMPEIMGIARDAGLLVVEDCAQAHGARLGDRLVGTFGDAASFSFYPTKNLGALGDGGMVVAGDPAVAARVRMLRQYGWRDRYVSAEPGVNSRLDEIQAAVLRVGLRHLDEGNERRRAIAARYDAGLAGISVGLPVASPGVRHVYHQYVVRSPGRDSLAAYLRAQSIATGIHYPVPVHLQAAYAHRIPIAGPLAVTEELAGEILSLPMFTSLEDGEVDRVVRAIVDWAADSVRPTPS
jgi:dTDP-4-amino-4,6-dideoxygalactose transaminase